MTQAEGGLNACAATVIRTYHECSTVVSDEDMALAVENLIEQDDRGSIPIKKGLGIN